jgi:hypothetical protein
LPAPPEKQPEKEPVEIPTPSQKQAAAPAPFAVLGANRKGLVLLVRLPEAAFRALPDLEFLQKLLKAIHHGPEDVAYVNALEKTSVSLAALQAALPVKDLISFGLPVEQKAAGAPAAPYMPSSADGVKFLLADELVIMVNSQEKKVQLWNGLKQMFLK